MVHLIFQELNSEMSMRPLSELNSEMSMRALSYDHIWVYYMVIVTADEYASPVSITVR